MNKIKIGDIAYLVPSDKYVIQRTDQAGYDNWKKNQSVEYVDYLNNAVSGNMTLLRDVRVEFDNSNTSYLGISGEAALTYNGEIHDIAYFEIDLREGVLDVEGNGKEHYYLMRNSRVAYIDKVSYSAHPENYPKAFGVVFNVGKYGVKVIHKDAVANMPMITREYILNHTGHDYQYKNITGMPHRFFYGFPEESSYFMMVNSGAVVTCNAIVNMDRAMSSYGNTNAESTNNPMLDSKIPIIQDGSLTKLRPVSENQFNNLGSCSDIRAYYGTYKNYMESWVLKYPCRYKTVHLDSGKDLQKGLSKDEGLPAFLHCSTMNMGALGVDENCWFVPGSKELFELMHDSTNVSAVAASLTAIGGDTLSTEDILRGADYLSRSHEKYGNTEQTDRYMFKFYHGLRGVITIVSGEKTDINIGTNDNPIMRNIILRPCAFIPYAANMMQSALTSDKVKRYENSLNGVFSFDETEYTIEWDLQK